MKSMKIISAAVMSSLLLSVSVGVSADDRESIIAAIKVKELTLRKEALEKQIASEDSKRNQTIAGVSLQTQELLNDRQDSVCLALRSQLVSLELELKEWQAIDPETESAIVEQLNNMKENGGQSSNNY